MGKYQQMQDGDGVQLDPDRQCMRFACCDCGLVHRIEVIRHRKSRHVTLQWFRDKRRTGQLRRRLREAEEKPGGDEGTGD